MALPIEDLGRLIAAKRGGRGVRAAAIDVGTSPATLSRVENGGMPDLETFAKICRWLERDPREFLGLEIAPNAAQQAPAPETAEALGRLILAAQRALHARNRLIE